MYFRLEVVTRFVPTAAELRGIIINIKEGTYINSSPYSRAGLDHGDDDWLNVLGFGDKIYKFIKTIDKAILSKIGYI
jgi:hypothetical protein